MDSLYCRFCQTSLQHSFADLKTSPLSNSYLEPGQLNQKETYYPLHAYVCSNCFLVQLQEFETPQEIFSDYAYFSSYSESWLQHAEAYTEMMLARFALHAQSQVIEIASNDGYLLQFFHQRGIPVLGIEPAANVAQAAIEKGIPTRVQFFGCDTVRQSEPRIPQADLLVANNVLAHVPDLNDFVSALTLALKPNGVITIEVPHLLALIQGKQFDTIYHEHFSYFSLTTLQAVFKAHQFEIFDVDRLITHGGSLRLYVQHKSTGTQTLSHTIKEILEEEARAGLLDMKTYTSFYQQIMQVKLDLLQFFIDAKKQNKRIVAYGAPAKGNTLLNYCGIGTDFIDFTVDRNPHKQGRFLPGSRIPIYAPERIKEEKPDYLLILPWNLTPEIRAQNAYIQEWGGVFVTPLPTVTFYS
jgi:2-polyprenyl-3-methyl-5-hydroxy-6-metoxy-1,4-benzoquinol methylase